MDFKYTSDLEEFRKEFLKSEVEYLEQLIKVPEFIDYYIKFQDYNPTELIKRLEILYSMIEECRIEEKYESKVELQMICCCLAIEDYIKRQSLIKAIEDEEKIKTI